MRRNQSITLSLRVAPRSTVCAEQGTLRKPPTPRQRVQKRRRPRTKEESQAVETRWHVLGSPRHWVSALSTQTHPQSGPHLPFVLARAVPSHGHPTGTNCSLSRPPCAPIPRRILAPRLPSASASQLHAVALGGWAAEGLQALTSRPSSAQAPSSRCSLGPRTPATGSRCRQHGATVQPT